MRCLSPIRIRNPKPGFHSPNEFIYVPCGKCSACLETKANEWGFRLEYENSRSECSYFLTLTYEDNKLYFNEKGFPSVTKEHIQKFFKLFRKHVKSKFKYYAVAEYGEKTQRPHYHILLFGLPLDLDIYEVLSKTWHHGWPYVGEVTPASIRYVSRYFHKKSRVPEGCDPVFTLMSRRPGIGSDYVSDRRVRWHKSGEDLRNYAVKQGGQKVHLPRYMRDKIFNEFERRLIQRKCELDAEDKVLGRPAEYFEDNPHLYNDVLEQYEDKIRRTLKTDKL